MNKKSWLIVGLSLAMAASIGMGISACGGKDPDTPEHTHEYTKWEHSETQHWMVCPADDAIWAQGKVDHIFTNGTCECGMKEADVTPDEGLDTRVFYVVGSGAGDLKNCSFTELKSDFKLTKQPKKDENGYTVYTTSILTLYTGDTMKIVQDLDWDEGLGYFGVSNIKNNDGSLVDGGGPGNITPAVGKDGKYRFTVRTKPDIAFSECTLEFELIEPVEPLKNTEEIYIVGNLAHYKTQWPSGGSAAGCLKLNHDETTGEWSIVLRLGGKSSGVTPISDEFKLYNSVNGAYIPDGVNNNKHVSGTEDRTDPNSKTFYKASGDYKISWKTGDTDITITLLPHEHNFDDNRMGKDDEGHFTACWLDDTEEEGTRENHVYDDDADATCNKCGYERHVHTYDQWGRNETQHWKQCPTDKVPDESTRENHTFDPDTNKCECGMEKVEECDHEGTVTFSYTAETHPELVATGGTIKGTCSKCGKEVDVPYDVGKAAEGVNDIRTVPNAFIFEEDKTYYVTGENLTNATWGRIYLGYEIKAAGTLTMKVNLVYFVDETCIPGLRSLAITTKDFTSPFKATDWSASANKANTIIWTGNWYQEAQEVWKDRIEVDELDASKTGIEPLHSLKITFIDEDVGKYLHFELATLGMGMLFDVDFVPATEAIVAPAEVAMLPEKKD